VGVYRSLSTAKKAGKQLSTRFFCGTGFYKRRKINCQEKKKDELFPAIGKNYINKKVSFLLLFIYRCFYLSLTARNPKKTVTEKEDKKFPHIYPLLLFIFFFTGEGLTHRFQPLHLLYQNKNI